MKTKMIVLAILAVLISASSVMAQDLELDFAMPNTMMVPGSSCSLDLNIANSGPAMTDATLYVAMNIGTDDYWFYPTWVKYPSEIDSALINVSTGSSNAVEILPEFPWPTGAGEFSGAMFIGVIMHNDGLVSNVAQIDFGWTTMPETYASLSFNSDWIDGTFSSTTQAIGYSFTGVEGGSYNLWWDDSVDGIGTSTADVCVSAFHEDKTTPYFRDVDSGYTNAQSIIIAPGETTVYVVFTPQNNTIGTFKTGVTFFAFAADKSVNARQAAAWMTGDLNSENQSQQQPSYYHITLRMKRIWPEKTDGYWLYVEQAVAGNTPYRQRIYRVRMESDTEVASEVYTFLNTADEDAAVGAWVDANPLSDMTPADFEEKTGCAVYLTRTDLETMMGSTDGKGCPSSLNGATYATSEVTVNADQLTSWDRGYDSSDVQVWGAVAGPYIFDKSSNFDSDLDL